MKTKFRCWKTATPTTTALQPAKHSAKTTTKTPPNRQKWQNFGRLNCRDLRGFQLTPVLSAWPNFRGYQFFHLFIFPKLNASHFSYFSHRERRTRNMCPLLTLEACGRCACLPKCRTTRTSIGSHDQGFPELRILIFLTFHLPFYRSLLCNSLRSLSSSGCVWINFSYIPGTGTGQV